MRFFGLLTLVLIIYIFYVNLEEVEKIDAIDQINYSINKDSNLWLLKYDTVLGPGLLEDIIVWHIHIDNKKKLNYDFVNSIGNEFASIIRKDFRFSGENVEFYFWPDKNKFNCYERFSRLSFTSKEKEICQIDLYFKFGNYTHWITDYKGNILPFYRSTTITYSSDTIIPPFSVSFERRKSLLQAVVK